jgi:VWFA-related protein
MAGLTSAPADGQAPSGSQDSVTGGAPVITSPKKPLPDKELPQQAAKIHVESLLVTAPVTVIDSHGNFIYDLDEKDFRVIDDGVRQRIETFGVAMNPVSVVIVVEANDTVAGLLPQLHPLGSLFSNLMLGDKGTAAVVAYSDRVEVAQDLSSDGDLLSKALGSLKSEGNGSRLNDALLRAIAMLEARPKGDQRVIVAFSDGRDHGSETKSDDIVRRATGSEVTIYGLGFNPGEALWRQKPPEEQPSPLDTNVTRSGPPGAIQGPATAESIYETPIPPVPIIIASGEIIRSTVASSLLEFYAGYTGGVFHKHWSKGALQEQLSKIATEIHSQYDLAYKPDTLGKPGFHRIEVEVDRPGLKVRTRAGYFYAPKPAEPK